MQDGGKAGAPKRVSIATLAQAEAAAVEIVRQAQADAERLLADAEERARKIREGLPNVGESAFQAEREAETEEKRRHIFEAARATIEEMRQAARDKEGEAVRKLVALLLGGP